MAGSISRYSLSRSTMGAIPEGIPSLLSPFTPLKRARLTVYSRGSNATASRDRPPKLSRPCSSCVKRFSELVIDARQLLRGIFRIADAHQ
jgi:hypothetical protein